MNDPVTVILYSVWSDLVRKMWFLAISTSKMQWKTKKETHTERPQVEVFLAVSVPDPGLPPAIMVVPANQNSHQKFPDQTKPFRFTACLHWKECWLQKTEDKKTKKKKSIQQIVALLSKESLMADAFGRATEPVLGWIDTEITLLAQAQAPCLLGHSPVPGGASREAAAPAPQSGQIHLPCHALHLLMLMPVRFQLH